MKLDDAKKLHQKKYRTQFGFYLVEGEHLVLELQKSAQLNPENFKRTQLYVTEEYQEWANNIDTDFKIFTISKKQMAQLSDTKSPQGIIACVPLPDLKQAQGLALKNQNERCIYLHEVQDPGNLGTILRTLAWFGGFRLLISPNSVDPFNPKVVRSSMGAIFHVPMELDVELRDLSNRFETFAYLDMNGEPVNSPAFTQLPCYLFGNEARGVPRDALQVLNTQAFTIPGSGAIESLNLASAVNMCVYQLSV
ncbi:RNA methyltransferase [Oceaniserpentilla sp. 4NH20-0058]|uniref:TrmH family RNA methyltransferase n=1 Tax=Oceaniserpentilla sp. 4NH20-0058 TaxID=3127660 RepID=UPI00310BD8BD